MSPTYVRAALVTAAAILVGVLAGTVLPVSVTPSQVSLGTWAPNATAASVASRVCVEGDVWLSDGVRAVGHLPFTGAGGGYCWQRTCFAPADPVIASAGPQTLGAGALPTSTVRQEPWQAPWSPLTIWCGAGAPSLCACRPLADAPGSCQWAAPTPSGPATAAPAPFGTSLQPGTWSGGCSPTPCVALAGRPALAAPCSPPPPPSIIP